jgi:Tfp pilus assembly protein PilE
MAVVLLASMLGIAGALAYQAQYAARSHRTAAESVLRDYATFAAWEFSRAAANDLTNTVQSIVGQAALGCRDGEPPDVARFKTTGG